ncbi:MAG TPA: hypothetical protein VNQ99_17400 [Xanthobacteraceae bacterium]|nr:hypothetical protein [Xanthobacteraceae bacterium]
MMPRTAFRRPAAAGLAVPGLDVPGLAGVGRALAPAVMLLGVVLLAVPGAAQTVENAPAADDGRYMLNRSGDGYVRLDSKTGQVSLCTRRTVGWACQAMPDDRAALEGEIDRLQSENALLKKELISRDIPLPAGTRNDVAAAKGEELKLRLPTEAEINKAMSFLGEAWRRLLETVQNLHNELMKKT